MSLIDNLIQEGWLKTAEIIEAFRRIKRVDFLPEDIKDLAELNEALPIGYGQTISQPLVVAFMLEKLQPEPGDRILDVGAGSGWTSALLAEIVGKKGRIIALEIVPELLEFGKKNVAKYNFREEGRCEFVCADGSKGYQKEAPFDKILVSASAEVVSPSWKEQLKIGGRIVAPIGSSIWLFVKKSLSFAKATAGKAEEFEEIEYPGFAFVPLITK